MLIIKTRDKNKKPLCEINIKFFLKNHLYSSETLTTFLKASL